MWYEKDFTIPVFCKTVKFKQLYDIGLYDGQFEVSKKQAEKIVMQLDNAVERYEMSKKQSCSELTYKEIEIKENTTDVEKLTDSSLEKNIVISDVWNLSENIEVLGFYYVVSPIWDVNCDDGTHPPRSLFYDGNMIDRSIPHCNMIVYKDTNSKYYFRICRYVRRDWFKPQEW